jgi:hypothetical protein
MTLPYVARSLKMEDLHLAYSQTFFNILMLFSTTLMGNFLKRLGYRFTLALPFVSIGISSLILVYATVSTNEPGLISKHRSEYGYDFNSSMFGCFYGRPASSSTRSCSNDKKRQ